MTRAHWQYEDEAPEGWELAEKPSIRIGRTEYSAWRDIDGEPIFVPTRWERCDNCFGRGCLDCDSHGGFTMYAFNLAVSKTVALRLKATGQTDVAGLQWWSERR